MLFDQLHFIRPLWLLALVPSAGILLVFLRHKDAKRAWQGIVADHLLDHMVSQQSGQRGIRPHVLLGVVLTLICLALAGPTWQREPAPFADDTAALVIAVEVTPTMLAQDVQPSRLERAALKIHDLLALRRGSVTALVAYAGSAHLVLPLTQDGELITEFAAQLDPSIMPAEGDAADRAVELAQAQLTASGRSGSVLLVTDGMSPQALARLEKNQAMGGPRVHVYGIAAGEEAVTPLGSPPAPPLDRDHLKRIASAGRGTLVLVTPDGTDVERLARVVATQFSVATNPEGGDRWRDFGYWLVPVLALLCLCWFRPGWTVHWHTAAVILLLVLGSAGDVRAAGAAVGPVPEEGSTKTRFWFVTSDQKAQRLFDKQEFAAAAAYFMTPQRRGLAWYRAGEFTRAAAEFGRTGTAEGAFNRANALVMLGKYEEAIKGYEQALRGRPDWAAAAANLALAQMRLARLAPPEDAVSQKAVGEDDEPDEIVFDDRAKKQENANTETIAGAGEELSDAALRALWLRRVETDPADFLRRKFAFQYHRSQEEGEAADK